MTLLNPPGQDLYEPLEVIGSGSFGVIRKIRRRSDGKVLARKEIDYRKMSDKEKKQLVTEVNILRELRHPNIVRYFERSVDRENSLIHIIMEYCEGGDLATVIKRCKNDSKRIPENLVWDVLTQLTMALHECHHGSVKRTHTTILHRDIKPENVFLDSNQNAKLGDFGLSKVVDHPENEFAKTYVGTPFYMSPELVGDSSYNTKSDIWALGCLIYELCTLEPPFQAKTQQALATRIQIGNPSSLPSFYSMELNRVVKAMLATDHVKRPSTIDLLAYDRISVAAKEREMTQLHLDLKKREDELSKEKDNLRIREESLMEREHELILRERNVTLRERALRDQEKEQNDYVRHVASPKTYRRNSGLDSTLTLIKPLSDSSRLNTPALCKIASSPLKSDLYLSQKLRRLSMQVDP